MNQSTEINHLNEALSKAQSAFPAIPKNKTAKVKMKAGGEFSYKYADLADVLSAVMPKLTEQGLCLRQPIRDTPKGMRLFTEVHHSTGQWASDDGLPISNGLSPQELGSELTYMRRYGACGMLGIAPDVDEDAMLATAAKGKTREERIQAAGARNERSLASPHTPEVTNPLMINEDQKTRLQQALKTHGKKAADMYAFLDMKVGSPIPASRFQEVLLWVSKPASEIMPKAVSDAFSILDWTEYERDTFTSKHENNWTLILKSLNSMIDAENNKEQ